MTAGASAMKKATAFARKSVEELRCIERESQCCLDKRQNAVRLYLLTLLSLLLLSGCRLLLSDGRFSELGTIYPCCHSR